MLIIDRYLLRQFVQTFVICYLSLLGLYIIFDAFTNMEEFLRCGEKSGGVLGLMSSFYACQSIVFFDRTSGLLSLISAMFTVAWIQRHHEMTALMAAGVSRIRILRPVIAAAVVVSLLAAVNREVLIPRFRSELTRRPQDLIGDAAQELQPRYDNQTDVLIGGKATYDDRQQIAEPNFLLPPALSQYGKRLVAKEACYQPPENGRPGGYLLSEVQEPKGLRSRPSLLLDGRPVLITPRDAPGWLEANQCFVVSQVTFDQLTGSRTLRQFASTAQLISGLRNPSLDFGAEVRVAIHARLIQPLLDITLLFLGLPLVASRESRNVFIAIGLCMVVVAVFLLVAIGLQYLGSIYLLDPALAAWAPLLLFVPPAVGLAEGMWN
jgi:lipopolysaccharide export system permease protein